MGSPKADLFQKCRSYTRHKEAEANGLYPYFKAIESGADAEVMIRGRRMIMIGSNNYLGLTTHPKVKEAAKRAIDKYGSGCTGSRFLNGTLDIHEELEHRLARFVRKEKALLFSTGFQTNLGTISTLVGKDDVILCDRMNHASIIDGCRLAWGRTIKFKHNDIEDLERILTSVEMEEANGSILVITEGVFSMEGDLGVLPDIVALKRKYGFRILLDDAHGIGYMGPGGRGTAEHFGAEAETDLIMGTFSKSFASLGGFIAGEGDVIDYIKHHARALIFSASMPPASVATVLAALDVMEREPEHRERLWRNTRKMQAAFRSMGFNIGRTQSPVVPIIIGDFEKTLIFWKELFEAGVFVNPIVSPAVPPDMCLLRTSYMATHTDDELDRVLEIMGRIGKKLGVL
ncbi:MAG TPA: pyridoxal phosphate-dependent aminotransferase family protein [Planctomycetota bacterium]|jgi:8-amino-7-oxononanoate synthase|nr:pyridoxal phosphate-dependent aminotransferase family protein [Planctomycetota bacterium]